MKKIIFILAGFIALSATAQNPEAIQKKIDKNDISITDPKKMNSGSTWVDRANLFIELSNAYTSKIVQGITLDQAIPMIGKPLSEAPAEVGSNKFIKYEYENFAIYTTADTKVIQFWIAKKGDELSALNNSYESLVKLKSVSEKDFNSKGILICDKLTSQFSQNGRTYYSLGDIAKAAAYFEGAAKTSELSGKIDTMVVYYAGIALTEAKEYQKALAAFDKVLACGVDEGGMVYIYLSSCYEGIKDDTKAVQILETGFEKNPNNANILSALINIYLKNEIDPQKLISIIQKAESLDPKNASLYLVEGTVWDKIGDAAKAEEAFAKSIAIDGKNFNTFFNLGLLRARRGDDIANKANKLDINDVKGYNTLIDEALAIYSLAIEALEKAHELDAADSNTIDLLTSLYFQRRDKDDASTKRYEYFKALKGK